MKHTPLAELNLLDDFLFNALVSYPEYGTQFCKKFLKILFQKEFQDITIIEQKTYEGEDTDLHGARLDLYVEEKDAVKMDEKNVPNVYDLEPDKNNEQDSLGTCTKSLSRTDIQDISKKLPNYEEWKTEKFTEVKNQIKQEYHLGSKEFSDAVDLIKKNRLFSTNIGCEQIFGTITEDELKEYASLVKYYCEKEKARENAVLEWDNLAEIQKNAMVLREYLSKISIDTLNTLLCFYEMSNGGLPVEKLEGTYEYIVGSSFEEIYMIRKLKQKNVCLRIIDGMRRCGQVTYEKQLQAALKEEGVDL